MRRIFRIFANDMELQENSIIVSDRLDGVFDVELRNHFTHAYCTAGECELTYNGRSSKNHQVRLDGRVVTDEGEANMAAIVSWSQMTWHQFLPTEIVKQLRQPYLVITAENAFTRPGAEQMYQNAASEVKELQVIAEATHFDMYDLEEYVTQNLQHIERFLKANL